MSETYFEVYAYRPHEPNHLRVVRYAKGEDDAKAAVADLDTKRTVNEVEDGWRHSYRAMPPGLGLKMYEQQGKP